VSNPQSETSLGYDDEIEAIAKILRSKEVAQYGKTDTEAEVEEFLAMELHREEAERLIARGMTADPERNEIIRRPLRVVV
jgi:hypothetical protein